MSELEPLPHPPPSPKERVAYLDNARYWVIILVVIGHSLTQLVVMDSARGVYTWIFLFHMPFFVLISGYTARHYVGDFRQVRRIISTLIVPYLLVETSMQLITQHYDGSPKHLMILSPQWIGWFLAALFIWRLTTPIWRALRFPITTSVVISLAAGLFEIPNVLALPKVLGLLPFYVIGLHFTKDMFLNLTRVRTRVLSAFILASSLIVCLVWAKPLSERWSLSWLVWRIRYDEAPLSVGAFEGLVTRGWFLAIAFTLTLATLSLIPKTKSWTTLLGSRTLYAYLLHGYVILLLDRQFGLWERIEPYGAVSVVGCIIAATILANVLLTKPVATAFKPLFEPQLTRFFRRPETTTDLPHPSPTPEPRPSTES